MILPSFKRLFTNDYKKEYQELVQQLSDSLNTGIETLYFLGNKKISLRDNILCSVKDVELIVNGSGTPTSIVNVGFDVSGKVEGVEVIRADNLTNSTVYPTNAPFISFQQTSTSIIINNITGLASGYKWRVRVIIWQS